MKLRRRALACSLVALTAVACGARGPLDDYSPGDAPTADAGSSNTTPGTGTSPGTGAPGTGTPGTGTPGSPGSPKEPAEAGAIPPGTVNPGGPVLGDDGGLIDCGTCVATQCGSAIATCLADTTCSTALQCIATTCLGTTLGGLTGGGSSGSSSGSSGSSSGGGGASCFLGCGGGSITGLTSLLPIFTCLTSTCGTDCGSLLGGLGGLVRDKEITRLSGSAAPPPNAGKLIFSAYPQICGAN